MLLSKSHDFAVTIAHLQGNELLFSEWLMLTYASVILGLLGIEL